MKNLPSIEQAKTIPIADYLAAMGHDAVKRHRGELWYRSPFRTERTPSFSVEPERNIWWDFGAGEGGSIIDLVMQLHGIDHIPDVLEHLSDYVLMPIEPSHRPVKPVPKAKPLSSIKVRHVRPLTHLALRGYLEKERKIPYATARAYLKEVWYDNGARKGLFAIGWENLKGAYELRARVGGKDFKSVSGKKDLSLLRQSARPQLFLFEGMMDFLSYLVILGVHRLDGTVVVLNSTSFVKRFAEQVLSKGGYEHILTFFDNDAAGQKAFAQLQELTDIPLLPQTFFHPFEDVNQYLVQLG